MAFRFPLLCALAITCNAFHLQSRFPTSLSSSPISPSDINPSTLMVASGLITEQGEECLASPTPSGPASVFGRPIDQETRVRNRELIKNCKSVLFDTLFRGREISRSYARFYALENIARMPYFSYLSVLHLYESLGWWRKAEYLKVHFAESWNEQHHLLIMEEMGGSDRWIDRFIAQHVAVFYYWIVVTLYMHNPTMAYNLNQAVEEEAFATYSNFIEENKEYLKSQPAPRTAKKYYAGDDLYLFDAMHFQGNGRRDTRRPKMDSLLDAFSAVRDDEMEHVKTMAYLQEDACLAEDQ